MKDHRKFWKILEYYHFFQPQPSCQAGNQDKPEDIYHDLDFSANSKLNIKPSYSEEQHSDIEICQLEKYLQPEKKIIKFLIQLRLKSSFTIGNGNLLFNCYYLSQCFIKWSNQGQFWNQRLLKILKLNLVDSFYQLMVEMLTVKEKVSISDHLT